MGASLMQVLHIDCMLDLFHGITRASRGSANMHGDADYILSCLTVLVLSDSDLNWFNGYIHVRCNICPAFLQTVINRKTYCYCGILV